MNAAWSIVCSSLLILMPAHCARADGGPHLALDSSTASQTLVEDSPRSTVEGNGFVAPAGWSLKTAGPAVILTTPEGDSHLALVDVGAAKDADAAVAAAWAAYDPNVKRLLKRAGERPVRRGWQEVRSYQYGATGDAQRQVSAQALRRHDRWTVVISDMADAVRDKRDSQVELVYGLLQPKGYTPETFAGKTARTLDPKRLNALSQFLESARQQFDVPGAAMGIVQGGKVVSADGFGVRAHGRPEKVDADTLFLIASNTKPLTTLMLAKLVDAGRFTWDTPVTQVMPGFQLANAEMTQQMRMKHLVCACTGLPRQDMESSFEGERQDPAAVMATLATMRPTSAFGELYQYSNPMAAAAGFVGGYALHPKRELGAGYDLAMQSLVFDPLGMASTTFDFERAQRRNHAAPHTHDIDGRIVPANMDLNKTAIPMRPDGGAWSNVNDMLRYVRMELARGALPDGERYISEAPLLARREQQVTRGPDQGYGMGLKLDRSSGALMVSGGGTASGYVTEMFWLPDHDVGAVLLTNADAGGVYVRSLFRRRLLELLFDGDPEAVANMGVQSRRMKESIATEREELTLPIAPALVDTLASRYRSKELGDIDVVRKDEAIWFDFGGWKSEVASRRRADGSLAFVTLSPGGFEFAVTHGEMGATAPGRKPSLVLRDAQHEYLFVEAE